MLRNTLSLATSTRMMVGGRSIPILTAVLALGARRLSEPGAGSRVFADPAGHPFCLIPRPVWAEPVGPAAP